jgi:hypothetical protein
MMRIALVILILLAAAAGIVWLQIFLSKREGKWFGLILPAISLIGSLVVVSGIVAFSTKLTVSSYGISQDGAPISHEVVDTQTDFGPVLGQAVSTFLIGNIPTAVLITIYAACREKRKRSLEIGKMQAQDLE